MTRNPYTGDYIFNGAGNPASAGGLGQEGVLTAYHGYPRRVFSTLGRNF